MTVHNDYRPMVPPPSEPIEPCPCCGSAASVWEYSEKPTDEVQRVVMCEKAEDLGPREGLVYTGCLLYMPPNDFYKATGRDAVRYWNEFAKATNAHRRMASWARHSALRAREQDQQTAQAAGSTHRGAMTGDCGVNAKLTGDQRP